jgi:hypothetical protein
MITCVFDLIAAESSLSASAADFVTSLFSPRRS